MDADSYIALKRRPDDWPPGGDSRADSWVILEEWLEIDSHDDQVWMVVRYSMAHLHENSLEVLKESRAYLFAPIENARNAHRDTIGIRIGFGWEVIDGPIEDLFPSLDDGEIAKIRAGVQEEIGLDETEDFTVI